MNDNKGSIPRKPNRMSLFYFIIACLLITIPFAVYWFFIMEPMQKMIDK
jgi:hypothetical protein